MVPASDEQIDLLVGADSPFASRRSLRLTELLNLNWVMQARGAPIRMAIEDKFLAAGARLPARVTNTSSLLVTLAMLEAPDTVAPVSREVAGLLAGAGPHPGVVRLPLEERIVVAPYLLISTRGRRLSPLAQRCRDMVAEMLTGGDEAGRDVLPARRRAEPAILPEGVRLRRLAPRHIVPQRLRDARVDRRRLVLGQQLAHPRVRQRHRIGRPRLGPGLERPVVEHLRPPERRP